MLGVSGKYEERLRKVDLILLEGREMRGDVMLLFVLVYNEYRGSVE